MAAGRGYSPPPPIPPIPAGRGDPRAGDQNKNAGGVLAMYRVAFRAAATMDVEVMVLAVPDKGVVQVEATRTEEILTMMGTVLMAMIGTEGPRPQVAAMSFLDSGGTTAADGVTLARRSSMGQGLMRHMIVVMDLRLILALGSLVLRLGASLRGPRVLQIMVSSVRQGFPMAIVGVVDGAVLGVMEEAGTHLHGRSEMLGSPAGRPR